MKTWLTAVFILVPAALWSAPNTTAVTYTGSLSSGTVLTITGTNFGATGPTQVLRDDFESGVTGSSVATGAGSAVIGQWLARGATGSTYDTGEHFSGSRAMMADFSLGANGGNFYQSVSLSSTTRYFYCESWKVTGGWPGYYAGSSGVNVKDAWAMFGTSTQNSDFYTGFTGTGSVTANLPNQWLHDGNDLSYVDFFSFNTSSSTNDGTSIGWHQRCEWIEGNDSSHVYMYTDTSTGTIKNGIASATESILDTGGVLSGGAYAGYWDRIHFIGFGRITSGVKYWVDDIYVSSGTSAAAHVWLTDQPRFIDSSKFAVATIGTWSDTSLSITVPTNNFSNGAIMYVVVCDANFVCDDSGFRLNAGSSLLTGTRSPFSGVTIQGVTVQ